MYLTAMRALSLLLAAVFLLAALPAGAEDFYAAARRCLTKDQRRTAISTHQAVPLATAFLALRHHARGEVVRASLCHSPHGLVYVLTVLAKNGKVTRVTVNAATGAYISRR